MHINKIHSALGTSHCHRSSPLCWGHTFLHHKSDVRAPSSHVWWSLNRKSRHRVPRHPNLPWRSPQGKRSCHTSPSESCHPHLTKDNGLDTHGFWRRKRFPCQDRFHTKLSSPAFLPVHVLNLSFRTVPALDSLLGIKGTFLRALLALMKHQRHKTWNSLAINLHPG